MQPDSKLQALIARAPRWPVLPAPLPREQMPRHVAIIMDGNGRWATQRGLIRINGHRAGVDSVRSVTRYCGQVHIQALTLYAFSTENWKRPKAEIRLLFRLLKKYLVEERPELMANGVRLTSIGDTGALPEDVQAELKLTQELTAQNKGLNLCLALNYGAQGEILNAAQALARRVTRGELKADDITEDVLKNTLYTAGMPPLDLLIRTAGERRLSNFLLWQACDAEFYVTPVCWPEFEQRDLEAAVLEFARRRSAVMSLES
ncbi:MAG TPA: polyprenyl diphosphate synthase [Planctomycetota bacterium]|nr:polyprenyl diphosphate synthase [Planctomycetota bacterium]